MLFNLPKHKVHKEALKLNQVCMSVIQSVWNSLEKNKLRTLDEDTYTAKVKDKLLNEKKGILNMDVDEEQV